MVTKIKKDITTITDGIIVHQVNNRGFMGRGISGVIKSLYPEHFNEYMDMCIKIPANKLLGRCAVTEVDENLTLVGAFIESINLSDNSYIDFNAMKKCMIETHELQKSTGKTVYIPYLIGCNGANKNWKVILGIISKYVPEAILCYN